MQCEEENSYQNKLSRKNALSGQWGAGISLDETLMATAIKCKVLPKLNPETIDGEPNDQKQSGKHWAEMRVKILNKAVKFLNSPPEGYALFNKKDHRINITQLRDAIVNHGHDLVWENGKSAGADIIYQTIQEAIKGKSKPQKTRD